MEQYNTETQSLIKSVSKEVVMLLLEKNKNYGDTANNPPQINPVESEDTLKDLIGYLILLKVQIEKENNKIKNKIFKSKEEKLKEFK